MAWALLDSNVYIGHWERGLYHADLEDIRRAFVIRQSTVVLSELRRGARTVAARKLVDDLHRLAAIQWAPTAGDWWDAGPLIRDIGDREGWNTNKRRDFQNDVLIALTARRHGAIVVTANRSDFALLAKELRIRVFSVR